MGKRLLGISPLIVFIVFYFGTSIIANDFSKVPIAVAFLVASIYAVCITGGMSLPDRVRTYGRGAGTTKMMFMIWIFVIAGAFSRCAQEMGCIQESVDFILNVLPTNMIYVSIFIAGCFISMATGSGLGSIVAVAPIAIAVSEQTGTSTPMMCALVVCSAMFGDNLSFISDTTIIATTTQGCALKDKFKTNFWIVIIPALCTLGLYYYIGQGITAKPPMGEVEYVKIIPYVLVLILAISGVDVLITLTTGIVVCGILGLVCGSFDFYGWMNAIGSGIESMGSIALIVLMAGGLMALIKHNGGIDTLLSVCTKFIRGRRSAEASICVLTGLLCICTANNTIAIMSVADITKGIATKYKIAPRKAASLMDVSSCIIQEVIPYSAHLLVVASLAKGVFTTDIIPYVYYVMFLTVSVLICIIFNIPRVKYTSPSTP